MGRKENPVRASDAAPITVGGRLRQLRHEHNLTLNELASRLGYTKPYLSAVENGTNAPSHAIVAAYAAAFRVPLESLTGTSEPQEAVATENTALDAQIAQLARDFGLA